MSSTMQMVLLFVGGLFCGGLLTILLLPAKRKAKTLVKERDQALTELKQHKEKVDSHFLRTAELVNQLTVSYRAVHEQLSEGARDLCSEEGRNLAMSSRVDTLPGYPGSQSNSAQITEQPLDYAPTHKGGMLSEEYGLTPEEPTKPLFTPVDDTSQKSTDVPLTQQPLDYPDDAGQRKS